MGTTWGDLSTWGGLDLWWIPNAIQAAGTLAPSSTANAGGNLVFAHAPATLLCESFAAASRTAITAGVGVVDLSASADAAVVSTETADAAAVVALSASAAATRTPPADVPAGALRARHR